MAYGRGQFFNLAKRYLIRNEDEMCRTYSKHGEKRITYRVFVGKRGGKRPLGRPRLRWEDNIKMEFRERG